MQKLIAKNDERSSFGQPNSQMATLEMHFWWCICSRQLPSFSVGELIVDHQFWKSLQPRKTLVAFMQQEWDYLLADSLGLPMNRYVNICVRVSHTDYGIKEVLEEPLQELSSSNWGLDCIFIAHYVCSSHYPNIPLIFEEELLRFIKHFFDMYSCEPFMNVKNKIYCILRKENVLEKVVITRSSTQTIHL